MASILDSSEVHRIFTACCVKHGENVQRPCDVQGIKMQCRFNPHRLAQHKESIAALLQGLADGFKTSVGGSAPYAEFGITSGGHPWTHDERAKERLLLLGLGAGLITLPEPRRVWVENNPLVSIQI